MLWNILMHSREESFGTIYWNNASQRPDWLDGASYSINQSNPWDVIFCIFCVRKFKSYIYIYNYIYSGVLKRASVFNKGHGNNTFLRNRKEKKSAQYTQGFIFFFCFALQSNAQIIFCFSLSHHNTKLCLHQHPSRTQILTCSLCKEPSHFFSLASAKRLSGSASIYTKYESNWFIVQFIPHLKNIVFCFDFWVACIFLFWRTSF